MKPLIVGLIHDGMVTVKQDRDGEVTAQRFRNARHENTSAEDAGIFGKTGQSVSAAPSVVSYENVRFGVEIANA
jgi:hypothetical protein